MSGHNRKKKMKTDYWYILVMYKSFADLHLFRADFYLPCLGIARRLNIISETRWRSFFFFFCGVIVRCRLQESKDFMSIPATPFLKAVILLLLLSLFFLCEFFYRTCNFFCCCYFSILGKLAKPKNAETFKIFCKFYYVRDWQIDKDRNNLWLNSMLLSSGEIETSYSQFWKP